MHTLQNTNQGDFVQNYKVFSPKLVNNFKTRAGGGIFSKLTKNEGSQSSMTNNKIVQEQMKWQQKYPNNSLSSFKAFMPV